MCSVKEILEKYYIGNNVSLSFVKPDNFRKTTAMLKTWINWCYGQRYTYRVLQTIQMKLILLCVWAEPAVLGSTKTALKIKYEI